LTVGGRPLLSFVVKGWKSSYLTSGRLKNVLCPTNKVDFFYYNKHHSHNLPNAVPRENSQNVLIGSTGACQISNSPLGYYLSPKKYTNFRLFLSQTI